MFVTRYAPATLAAQGSRYHITKRVNTGADRPRPRPPMIPGSFTILVLER